MIPPDKYRRTKGGIRYVLSPSPSRLDILAGEGNPFKRPPRGKFEAMQAVLDLPFFVYTVNAAKDGKEIEHRLDLPMLVMSPQGRGVLDHSIQGEVGVILESNPTKVVSFPVDQVDPLPEWLDIDAWLDRAKRQDREVI